jgi:hypothetical protein
MNPDILTPWIEGRRSSRHIGLFPSDRSFRTMMVANCTTPDAPHRHEPQGGYVFGDDW